MSARTEQARIPADHLVRLIPGYLRKGPVHLNNFGISTGDDDRLRTAVKDRSRQPQTILGQFPLADVLDHIDQVFRFAAGFPEGRDGKPRPDIPVLAVHKRKFNGPEGRGPLQKFCKTSLVCFPALRFQELFKSEAQQFIATITEHVAEGFDWPSRSVRSG